jgi:trk system potassium uptake protein TrkH
MVATIYPSIFYETRCTAVATTLNCVGPGLAQVGGLENFEAVNAFGRVVLTVCMLLGRLEIFTALALLSPSFWRK